MATPKLRLAMVLLMVVVATPAIATEPYLKCDASKTKAAGKAFASILKCMHAFYADSNFDEAACITEAKDRMIAAFLAADTKGAGACVTEGNGSTLADEIAVYAQDVFDSF